jgi:protein-S-isoprenylcysteine O-methyltransferase Ste14
MKLLLRGILGGAVQLALFAALILVPAGLLPEGTWSWERGQLYVVGYGIVMFTAVVTLALVAPRSLEARLNRPSRRDQPPADRVITALIIWTSLAWFVFIPVDVFYLRLFPPPPLPVSAVGGLLAVAGYVFVIVTIYQNAYAIPVVADQTDRGQTLVDTGLYSVVRHPLYLGILPFFAGTALWLGSYAGVIAGGAILLTLVARIVVEEKTLLVTLPGYPEYTQRVRYRLIPYVW